MPRVQQPAQGMSPQQQQAMARRAMIRQFRRNTRQRFQRWGTPITVAFGTFPSQIAPQVGLVRAIYLYCDVQISASSALSGTVTARSDGPWSFIKRLQYITNLGSNNVWDCDGYCTAAMNYSKLTFPVLATPYSASSTAANLRQPKPFPLASFADSAGTTNDYINNPLFQYNPTNFATAVPTNVRFMLRIDVAVNPGLNFAQGLINLQAPQIQTNVQISFGQITDLFTLSNAGADTSKISITGTVTPCYEYYEIPNPLRGVPLPTGMLHCTLQDVNAIPSATKVVYTIPRQGLLLRLLQVPTLNGVLSQAGGPQGPNSGTATNPGTLGIDTFELQLNYQDTIYTKDWVFMMQQQFENFGVLPYGSYMHEFFGAMGLPGRGDFRDVIDTEAVTTTNFNTYVNSGATVASGDNNRMVREILLPFNTQAAGGPAAMVA